MTVTASSINTALEALADRTAVLAPKVQVYTPGAAHDWELPAHAQWVEIVLVGGGGGGSAAEVGSGWAGAGGGSGAVVRRVLPASQLADGLRVEAGEAGTGGVYDGAGASGGVQSTVS